MHSKSDINKVINFISAERLLYVDRKKREIILPLFVLTKFFDKFVVL